MRWRLGSIPLALLLLTWCGFPCRAGASPLADSSPTWRLNGLPRAVVPASLPDLTHRRMLMLGNGDVTSDDPLVWSADLDSTQNWSPLFAHGSAPRRVPILGGVIDTRGNRLVVWGDAYPATQRGTWALSLDSLTWTQLSTDAPPRRQGAGIIYDPTVNRILVLCGIYYSGTGNPYGSNDVWQFDLSSPAGWTTLSPNGPLPTERGDVMAIRDSRRNRIVMFGGRYVDMSVYPRVLRPLDEAWELALTNPPAWRFIPPTAPIPAPTFGPLAVPDSLGDAMLLVGDQKWRLDLSDQDSCRWTAFSVAGGQNPLPGGPIAIFDDARRKVVFGGGYSLTGVVSGQFAASMTAGGRLEFNVDGLPTWSVPFLSRIAPHEGGRVVLDDKRDRVVVVNRGYPFGGAVWTSSLWQPPDWIKVTSGDGNMDDEPIAFDQAADRLVTVHAATMPATVRYLPFPTGAWATLGATGSPDIRSNMSLTIDRASNQAIVFGGEYVDGTNHLRKRNDVWTLSLGAVPRTWASPAVSPPYPSPRSFALTAMDPVNHAMLMFGGIDTTGLYLSDAWSLSLDTFTWSQLASSGAGPPGAYFIDCDPARHVMYAMLGLAYPKAGQELWQLSLDSSPSWTKVGLDGTGPGTSESFGGVFDARRDMLVLCADRSAEFSTDTWAEQVWTLPMMDWTTPIELSLVQASIDERGAHVVWWSANRGGLSATVERREDVSEWGDMAEIRTDGEGYLRYDDQDVKAEHRYGYRLRVQEPDGTRYVGETSIERPAVASRLLTVVNPASRTIRAVVSLPAGAGNAVLELLDLAGRRIDRFAIANLQAPTSVELGRHVPPGVYVLSLVRDGRSLARARVAVIR